MASPTEAPAIEVNSSLSAPRVTRALDCVIAERGRRESIRADNRPEFTSRRFVAWAEQRGITLTHIQPGKPVQNSFIESFNGRLRGECLNANGFTSMADAPQDRREADRLQPTPASQQPGVSHAGRVCAAMVSAG
jgi:putative transposase